MISAKPENRNFLAEKGLLKQILIEAKIVEATEDFVRNLGVQWGFGSNQSVSGGDYGLGLAGGSNTLTTRQYSQNYPSQIPGHRRLPHQYKWPQLISRRQH